MTTFKGLGELRAAAGTDLGVSGWVPIPQEKIDGFAEVTGDHQWIHTDPERAAQGPFGTPIAHGFLTLSLISVFVEDLLVVEDVAMAVNYGLNKVRFPAPVPVGSRVRARGQLVSVEEIPGGVQTTTRFTIECDGAAKPVCVAESVARFLDGS